MFCYFHFLSSLKVKCLSVQFSSVQLLRPVRLFPTPCAAARQASLSITNSWSYSNSCPLSQTYHPTTSSFVIPFFSTFHLSPLRVFSNQSLLPIRWPKYWSLNFNICLSNEYSGLISFRMDWLDLLAFQGTLKSLLQHHSSEASIPRCSAFFIVQLLYPYMITGKNIALTMWTLVGKVMSLLFNMLSKLVKLCFQGASVF